jgi:hypothetical protein
MLKPLFFWTAAVLASAPLFGAEVHVSPSGDDAANGSERDSFRTIAHAAEVVGPGDVCILHPGTYRETLRPARSGTAEAPISFRAAGDGEVILSGTAPLENWEPVGENVYRARMAGSLGRNNQLFHRGRSLTEARWPNDLDGDPMTPDGAPIVGGSTDHLLGANLPAHLTTDNLRGAVLWAIPGKAWSSWTRTITSLDPEQGRIGFPDFAGDWWLEVIHNPASKEGTFYLVGARALLDAPGEWFYDESDGFVYLIPPDPAQAPEGIEFQARRTGIDLKDRAHIRVENLTLFGCSVDLEDAEFCTLSHIRARHIFTTRGGGRPFLTSMRNPAST